jgi:glycosyltransferase involved in cell wall biosynthesis
MDLLEVMELVIRERPHAHLTVVGKGEDAETDELFREAIALRELDEAITLAGYHQDVSPYYRQAAIFLLTSLHEGFCYTLLESKAYSLPCVAYDLPYLEMFREGKGILAVPHGDTAQMAKGVVGLLDNQGLLQSMGEEARESFLPYYERDMAALWKEIIDGSTHPVPGRYRFDDPEPDETLRLLCETEMFFTEHALQKTADLYYETAARETQSQLQELLDSKTFKLGNALMVVPRKVRDLLARALRPLRRAT